MRVLCAHAIADGKPGLYPETSESLELHATQLGHQVEFVDCTGKQALYHETMERLWTEQNDWANVEHDVVITGDTLASFDRCPWPWCCFLTELACGWTPGALGCVRFRTELMRSQPSAMVDAGKTDQSGVVARAWYRTDVRLNLILREAGWAPHVHGRVTHLNPMQKLHDPDGEYVKTLEYAGMDLAKSACR